MMNERTRVLVDALAVSRDERAYFMRRSLCAMFPDREVVPASSSQFDAWQFAKDGHCTCARRPEVIDDFQVYYYAENTPLGRMNHIDWCDVVWQEHQIEVARLAWQEQHCMSDFFWVIADTEDIAHRFLHAMYAWNTEIRGEVLVFQNGGWGKDAELYEMIKAATFDNLVLPDRLRREIQDDFENFFRSRALYEQYRIPWKRGVILIGPPGNGKTHTIKALINWLNVPCLYVKSFTAQYMGVQASIKQVFDRARTVTPCILVLEDIDSLITEANRSFFLNELDGFATNTGIVVIASTNHPERLDPALIDRPSRFDRKYYFELPAAPERAAYLERWNATLEPDQHMTDDALMAAVEATTGFSFAYLKELILSALMRWISHPERASMAEVMAEQCVLLREQMASAVRLAEAQPEPSDYSDEFRFEFYDHEEE